MDKFENAVFALYGILKTMTHVTDIVSIDIL